MALSPVAFLSVPYEDFAGQYVKFFLQGTTTPVSMATDAGGGTLLSKAEISSGGVVDIGFIKTAGNVIFVPHMEVAYDCWIIPTASEADANDVSNATQIADNIAVGVTGDAADVSDLAGVTGSSTDPFRQLLTWHSGLIKGGGLLVWDSTQVKSGHDGGVVFSPTVPFTATTVDYLNAVGETDSGGSGCWVRRDVSNIGPESFGAKSDFNGLTGTDDTDSFHAAIDFLMPGGTLCLLADTNYKLTAQKTINNRLTIKGFSRQSTKVYFTGTPTTTVQTFKTWRTEYNSGNFATSSDTAIACGFAVTGAQVHFEDVHLIGFFDDTIQYSTPFGSYPIPITWDCAIRTAVTDFSMTRVQTSGVFKLGGLYVDGSQPTGNTANDRMSLDNCQLAGGRYGLRIEGAYGEPISGDNFTAPVTLDTRGAGGISDFGAYNCQFAGIDIDVNTDLGTRGVRAFATDSGGVFIHGQLTANTAKRIQGIRFYNCRASGFEIDAVKMNYCNRVEFHGLHVEANPSGNFNTNGTSALVLGTDFDGMTSTINSQNLKFFGGEKSGEPDNLTYFDTTDTLISFFARDNGNTGSEILFSNKPKDKGTWTPILVGAGTAGTQTYATNAGTYTRLGNMIFARCQIVLTAFDGSTAGNMSINGLPYAASTGTGLEASAAIGLHGDVNLTTNYTQLTAVLGDGNDFIDLFQGGDNVAAATLTATGMNNTTRLFVTVTYETTSPTNIT